MNEQTINQEPINIDPPQRDLKYFLKKWWVWALLAVAIILAIALFSGGNGAIGDELLEYVNNDCTKTDELYEEVSGLYEKARNSDDDYSMYTILVNEVIPCSQELIDEAESLEFDNQEVKAVHDIYIDAINKQNQAFTLMLSALENQDYTIVTQANEKLDESRKLMREYRAALTKLAEEHDIEITFYE